MFENLSAAPPDPILGLSEAFQNDERPGKVNLTIGVYRDEQGQTPILDCVKEAEERLLNTEHTKIYLGIDGLAEFRKLAAELTLGDHVASERVTCCQSPGGTGALRTAADLLSRQAAASRVWCSTPTWPNHTSIFEAAGMETKAYPYLAADRKTIDFTALLDTLANEARRGDIVCLHACCHNPTGVDPTAEQWAEIAELTAERGVMPLIDFAYHGFGDGLDEDLVAISAIAKRHEEFLVCSSYSKNFGLYSERVGAMLCVCETHAAAERVASNVKQTVRSNYSNPPRHGGSIVATILGDPGLRAQWVEEVNSMRQRIHAMRVGFVEGMKQSGCDVDFSFLLDQRGMFSYSGLTPVQVDWLRTHKAIYAVGSGRINVAGITPSNLPTLTSAIAEALRN